MSMYIAVMICATLVNTHTDSQLSTGYTISSARWPVHCHPSAVAPTKDSQ